MSTFNWDHYEKLILSNTIKDNDHLVVKVDKRKDQHRIPSIMINQKSRTLYQWLYICKHKLDPTMKLIMKKVCDNQICINPDHWIDTSDSNAKYIIAAYNLQKNTLEEGECQLWTETKCAYGYGQMLFNGKVMGTHIISYLIAHKLEKIPDGLMVRHKCKNKNCVAINHLELGTHEENMKDRIRDDTSCAGSKHPKATIDEETALKIYQSKSGTISQKQRAELFGVTKDIVNCIDNGNTWTHITGHKKLIAQRKKFTFDDSTEESVYIDIQKKIKDNVTYVFDEETQQTHWQWKQYLDKQGYGKVHFKYLTMGAHILSFIGFNKKPIPAGLYVLHKCIKNRSCVNPDHLKLGTAQDNSDDIKKDGTKKLNRSITEETAEAIMRSKGKKTNTERAKEYNTTISTIQHIDRGTTWKDLRERLGLSLGSKLKIKLKKVS
jgi:hypothetical protein